MLIQLVGKLLNVALQLGDFQSKGNGVFLWGLTFGWLGNGINGVQLFLGGGEVLLGGLEL